MRFVNQLYYLPSVCRAISNAAASSPKDYDQALQNFKIMKFSPEMKA